MHALHHDALAKRQPPPEPLVGERRPAAGGGAWGGNGQKSGGEGAGGREDSCRPSHSLGRWRARRRAPASECAYTKVAVHFGKSIPGAPRLVEVIGMANRNFTARRYNAPDGGMKYFLANAPADRPAPSLDMRRSSVGGRNAAFRTRRARRALTVPLRTSIRPRGDARCRFRRGCRFVPCSASVFATAARGCGAPTRCGNWRCLSSTMCRARNRSGQACRRAGRRAYARALHKTPPGPASSCEGEKGWCPGPGKPPRPCLPAGERRAIPDRPEVGCFQAFYP